MDRDNEEIKEKEEKWNKYYERTKKDLPSKNLRYFLEQERPKPGKAIDLGCGIGNDTRYLIQNGFNVTAIDSQDVGEDIKGRLQENEKALLNFKKQDFKEVDFEKYDLVLANNSLPFCEKEYFPELMEKIKQSILPGGYFVGTFFGLEDDWNKQGRNLVFLPEEQIRKMFEGFEEIWIKEIKREELGEEGILKYWHIYSVIYKKI